MGRRLVFRAVIGSAGLFATLRIPSDIRRYSLSSGADGPALVAIAASAAVAVVVGRRWHPLPAALLAGLAGAFAIWPFAKAFATGRHATQFGASTGLAVGAVAVSLLPASRPRAGGVGLPADGEEMIA